MTDIVLIIIITIILFLSLYATIYFHKSDELEKEDKKLLYKYKNK